MDLSICIINWNTSNLLENCLNSIYDNPPALQFEVLIWDNGSGDNSAGMVRRRFPVVKLVTSNVNLGFTKPFNKLLERSKGRYILALHPDVSATSGALGTLVKFMDAHPEVGIAGAKLLYPDGTLNRSCFSFHTLSTELFKSFGLYKLFPKSKIFGKYELTYWDHNHVREVDWVSASCLMARREAMDQVGLLDENFFVWWADVDWCYRMKLQGWKIYYVPEAKLVHYERQSFQSGKEQFRANLVYKEDMYRIIKQACESNHYFFLKHYGSMQATILRGLMVLEFINKIIVFSLRIPLWSGSRQRAKERIKACWEGLKTVFSL